MEGKRENNNNNKLGKDSEIVFGNRFLNKTISVSVSINVLIK